MMLASRALSPVCADADAVCARRRPPARDIDLRESTARPPLYARPKRSEKRARVYTKYSECELSFVIF